MKCIQASQNGLSYRVTFKDTGKSAKENLLVRGVHARGSFCYLAEAEPKHSVVNISILPSELPDQKVIGFFAKYGKVNKLIRNLDKDGLEMGDHCLYITLTHHISSVVFLNPYKANVKYCGQPQCGFECNWWGHTNYRCQLKGSLSLAPCMESNTSQQLFQLFQLT